MMTTEQEVLDFVEENDVKFIRLAFIDLFGSLKNIAIMPSELPRALRGGIGFDAAAVKGFGDTEHSDLFLRPDPKTMVLLPWRPQTGRVARMMCDCLTPDGTLSTDYSRTILLKEAHKAMEAGSHFRCGPEYEFYLFELDENGNATLKPQDHAGYMDVSPLDKGENIRREIILSLEQMNMMPECSHHEQGPGQNEIDFHYAGPLTAADHAMAFKGAVRTIAAAYGLHASFRPKPLPDESGNGMHVNLSILKGMENIFEQKDGELSEEAQHAMAGILRHIREMTLFLDPIPSSYKRLGSCEAPKKVDWSCGSRSKLIRIPAALPGSGRMELRSPDPASNPYLVFALIIAAAMEGIEQKLPLQPAMCEDGCLPETLEEAVELASSSEFLKRVLPEGIMKKYITEKKAICEKAKADPEAVQQMHFRTI